MVVELVSELQEDEVDALMFQKEKKKNTLKQYAPLLKFCLIYLYSCKKLCFLLWELLVAALGP